MEKEKRKKLTIGIDIRSLMEGKHTGVEEYMHELLHRLFQIDQKNEYRLFYNSLKDIPAIEFTYPNVKTVRLRYPNKLLNFTLKYFQFPKIDKVLGGVDLLFVPNFRISPVSLACAKILTVHDLSFELFPSFFSLKRRLWHRFINPKREIGEARTIITVSEHTKQHLEHAYGTVAGKIVVSYPGSNPIFSSLVKQVDIDRVKQQYKLPEHFFLCLGTLEPRKNIEGVLVAFSNIKDLYPDLSLVIAGQTGWLFENIFRLSKKLSLEDRVRFIGFIPQEDKPALYKLARTFIYPSFFEGFGFPVLEAILSSKPLITSHTSSLPEVAQSHGLLVNPYDISQLIEAMKIAVQKPERRPMEDSASLEKNLRDQFSWDHAAKNLLTLFEQRTST